MKILHTADLHLDRPFEGLTGLPDALRKKLQESNLIMLKRIVDLAITEEVELVLFAGDVFHQNYIALKTQAAWVAQLERLAAVEIPVAIIFGNHDYYQEDRYWFAFPKNTQVFTSETVTTQVITTRTGKTVALSGFSYQRPWIEEHKALEFPPRAAVDYHIGLYHGELAHQEARYAPFTLAELKAKNYDYWALGHIHQPQILSQEPLIAYPGTPQGHTKKEQETGVLIYDLVSKQMTRYEVAPVRFQQQSLSLEKQNRLTLAQSFLQQELAKIWRQAPETIHLVFAKITDWPETPEFQRVLATGELLEYLQGKLSALSLQQLWLAGLSSQPLKGKKVLPLTEADLEQLGQNIQTSELFADLFTNPDARGLDFQNEPLLAALTRLKADFELEEKP